MHPALEIDEQEIRCVHHALMVPGRGDPNAIRIHADTDVALRPGNKPALIEALADVYNGFSYGLGGRHGKQPPEN
jgi:hypothetical protein